MEIHSQTMDATHFVSCNAETVSFKRDKDVMTETELVETDAQVTVKLKSAVTGF